MKDNYVVYTFERGKDIKHSDFNFLSLENKENTKSAKNKFYSLVGSTA